MGKSFVILVIASLLIISLESCKDRCTDNPYRTDFDTAIINNLGMYKPGNYWVFENKDKSLRDSLYVTNYSDSTNTPPRKGPPCDVKRFIMGYLHSRYLDKREDTYLFTLQSPSEFKLTEKKQPMNKVISFFSCYDALCSELGLGLKDNYSDSIFLNGIVYKSVVKEQYGYSDGFVYIQKSKGIIGWVNTNDTFNLIKYEIKK